jgi:cytochrome P450
MPIVGKRGTKLMFYRDPIAYHRHVFQTYGTLASFTAGGKKLLAYGPEYNRQIFNQPDVFYADRVAAPGPAGTALHRLGFGLNTMNGDLHRQQRRLMLPAFHRQAIEGHRNAMAATTYQLLERWPAGKIYDLAHVMNQLTLCIVSKALFGIDATERVDTLGHLIARWIEMNTRPHIHMFPIDLPGTPLRKLIQLSDHVESVIREILRSKRNHEDEQRDVLSMLVQAHDEDGTRMSEDELIGHTTLLFLAGFETSAVSLTWTLFLLAQHPRVMADVVDELMATLGGNAPTIEQVRELPLLDRVIKESLRLLPPAIHGGRIAVQPFAMGGYEFPVGTKVMYSEFMTHRLPDIYHEPDRFLPKRWEGVEPVPFAYIPFLGGPRRCLGAEFALLEMKLVLAIMLQRYRFSIPANAQIDSAVRFTLVPASGIPMLFAPRDRQFAKAPIRGNIHQLVDLS